MWTTLNGYWRPAVEILILAVAIYYAFRFVRGTRGWPVVIGFVVVLLTLGMVATLLDLRVLLWILKTFSALFAVAVLVIFQPELRRMLAELKPSSRRDMKFALSAVRSRGT
jgi:diadenylate cyclase